MKRGMPGITGSAKAPPPFSPGSKQLTVKAGDSPSIVQIAKLSPVMRPR